MINDVDFSGCATHITHCAVGKSEGGFADVGPFLATAQGCPMSKLSRLCSICVLAICTVALGVLPAGYARAADHGDAPNVAGDQAGDLADVFVFLDPADNSKLVIIGTF